MIQPRRDQRFRPRKERDFRFGNNIVVVAASTIPEDIGPFLSTDPVLTTLSARNTSPGFALSIGHSADTARRDQRRGPWRRRRRRLRCDAPVQTYLIDRTPWVGLRVDLEVTVAHDVFRRNPIPVVSKMRIADPQESSPKAFGVFRYPVPPLAGPAPTAATSPRITTD